jgi:8-oxo-dGTP pyrophosphatase MutT (NUDIX family)
MEETGLDVLRARAFGLYSDPKYSVTYPNGDEVQTFTVAFLVEEWRGELRVDDDEVTALRFFPLDALPNPIYPIHSRDDSGSSGTRRLIHHEVTRPSLPSPCGASFAHARWRSCKAIAVPQQFV